MRYRTEYLGRHIDRRRQIFKLPNLKLDKLVLAAGDVQKRLNWSLANIIEPIPGNEEKTGTVKLKTVYL